MTYKDPDRQREAQRDWVRQKRAEKGSTKQGSTDGSIPIETLAEVDTACGDKLSHGLEPERTAQGNIRVSKPGDSDYDGIGTVQE